MKILIISVFLLLSATACGPSAEEIAGREKAKEDSVAFAVQEQMLKQQAEAQRQKAVADSIANAISQTLLMEQAEAERQRELKSALIELKSLLAGEEQKLRSIERFQLLRTPDEKAQQVTEQTHIIETLKSQIEEIQTQIN
jgi:hypothetical protein